MSHSPLNGWPLGEIAALAVAVVIVSLVTVLVIAHLLTALVERTGNRKKKTTTPRS